MGAKEGNTHRHKPKRLADIQPSEHPYDKKSREWLRNQLYNDIKSVFVGALSAIESRLGKGFEAYPDLRGEILRLGNECIRKMHKRLDTVNVECIPEIVEFRCATQTKEDGNE